MANSEDEAEDAALYEQREAIFQQRFGGDNSNEGVFQFALNVPAKNTQRTHVTDKEKTRFQNDWLVKDVALDLRILRKKRVWYSIMIDLIKSKAMQEHFQNVSAYNSTFIYRGENWIIDPNIFVDLTETPLLKWFGNFVQHLQSRRYSRDNASLGSTIDTQELPGVASSHIEAQSHFLRLHKTLIDVINQDMPQAAAGVSAVENPRHFVNLGFEHLFRNTVNALCVDFAHMNYMTFSLAKNFKKNGDAFANLNSNMTQTARKIQEAHNQFVRDAVKAGLPSRSVAYDGPAPPNQEEHLMTPPGSPVEEIPRTPTMTEIQRATMYDAVFGKSPDGVPVENPVIPLDVLLESEAILERGNPDRDFEAEEGWEEHARKTLGEAGLLEFYPELANLPSPPPSPRTPPGEPPGTPQGPRITANSNSPFYEGMPTNVNDVADAAETAIQRFEDSRDSQDEIADHPQFLVTPAQFVAHVLGVVAPTIVTEYNDMPAPRLDQQTHPSSGTTDDHVPDSARDIPGSPEHVRLPSIADVLPYDVPIPEGAPVHADEHVCNRTADAFIKAWRKAKRRAYAHDRTRHFNINHGLFRSGMVCHRCYQLVRRHHEHYHLKSGRTVNRDKLAYPRHRTSEGVRRTTVEYNAAHRRGGTSLGEMRDQRRSRNKARRYTKALRKAKSPHVLRAYNKYLKK